MTTFLNGQCPAGSIVHERAKRASEEFGDRVIFRTINTSEKEAMLQYGEKDALYIDEKKITTGPPPSYEKIYKVISKRVSKL